MFRFESQYLITSNCATYPAPRNAGVRGVGGLHRPARQPATVQVALDAFTDRSPFGEGGDSHFLVAVRAQERVGFPDFLDEFAPLLGGDPAELVFVDVDVSYLH
jgi:hypothetical protein